MRDAVGLALVALVTPVAACKILPPTPVAAGASELSVLVVEVEVPGIGLLSNEVVDEEV